MNKLGLESFDKTTVTSRLVRGGVEIHSGVALGYHPSMAVFMRLSVEDHPDWMGQAVDECVQTNDAVEKLIISSLLYMKNVIYESGREDERAIWQAAELKIRKQSDAIMARRVVEYEDELKRQKSNLIGAFNESEKLRNNLERTAAESANHRLYINTRTTACSGNAHQTKAADIGGIGGAGERVYRAELDRETEQNIRRDYAEVAAGANVCKVLVELVENNFEGIR